MLRIIFCLFMISVQAHASNKVIYGQDNRNEVYNYTNQSIVELSKSTVALVKKNEMSWDGTYYRIPLKSYGSALQLCSNEKFYEQPTAAFCSGFLIAPNKIVTAGHCITSKKDCDNTVFIFNYRLVDKTNFYSGFKNIYTCKRVLGQQLQKGGVDFAVIELDEDVEGIAPLKLAQSMDNLSANDSVFTIGHPAGLPTKITDNAKVRSVNRNDGFFVTTLDTFGGNSGSPVFNAKTQEVEGILVRGDTDYVVAGSCRRENRINESAGRGETAVAISHIHEGGLFGDGSKIADDENFRYIWFSRFQTCNEFQGVRFTREVEESYCPVE
ncbi:trypsin-like serine peptidase [Peredibacter starrii]|uniref:Serine protease n=1 Tax=Peredibacter starrii TaxID=28202 RepID=A0AAX4HJY2_9BACT|nr:serine protease [Peredibacter starrii]WPU63537.1 serine protease [Peredibacter starrii]